MLKSLIHKFRSTLLLLFPANLAEWILLLFFLILYSSLSWVIASQFRIIFDNRIPWDAYFSFDNRAIVLTGGGFERHPFANYWFGWIKTLAFWFSNGKINSTFRFVLAELSSIAISFSILYAYKFLRNIISLNVVTSILFCVFYAFFSTNIMLSFTPETYTYSALFLSFFFYYAFNKLKQGLHLNLFDYLFSSLFIGGLTITNFAKVFLPLLFDRVFYKSWKNFWDSVLKISVSAIAFVFLYLWRLDFDYLRIINQTGKQYEKFTQAKMIPLWDMAASWFFGGNFLFSSFAMRDYHSTKGFYYKALFMSLYSSWVPYLFVLLLVILLLFSLWRNRYNKLVLILALSFLLDCFIHLCLGFGVQSLYIYGGHFAFAVLFLLAYLYQSYSENIRMQIIFSCVYLVMGLYMIANNLYRMQEFFEFCQNHYI